MVVEVDSATRSVVAEVEVLVIVVVVLAMLAVVGVVMP